MLIFIQDKTLSASSTRRVDGAPRRTRNFMNDRKPDSQSFDAQLRELRERNELLEALSDVGATLSGSFNIESILSTTAVATKRLVATEHVHVF